ncbi:AAA family ATPase [Rhodobacteraceae bacterium HSP-20]|uniref:AAA family ATPase n=1 Tax=Paragemmobacter amnigenus TaxID=2852097 RepID=A0ABS6J0H0_9RHOB|nr:ATP-binding protein [Rhodobacter amnigenus]MBU9697256.1 AAA family ATPase [Rhodobacter amnigenus]MBV4388483.1 AAA family ATPase [Rhodobacter amnigenus]
MKLVSIELSDLRRFVAPVRIDGIGPGLNVLCAPNEFGKSTLFDALQALFFQPHRSKSKEINALRPHVGGSPCVTVEVELSDARYTLSKRWLSKAQATVHRNGNLIHQADDAEAFISALVQSEGDGGPAGLLWVRQGLTRLEGEGDSAKERDAAKAARRNLMTSVTGEVEALTGGRRMDKALARTREELAKYVTATGRPMKGGPLSDAETLVATLTEEQARLEATARQLTAALARRRDVVKALTSLTAPDEVETRQTRLEDATRALDEAKRHADTLGNATAALRAAEMSQATLSDRLSALHRAQSACAKAKADLQSAEATARAAKETSAQADAALSPLADALAAARHAKTTADAELAEANRAVASLAAAARRKDLADRIGKARALLEKRAPLALAATRGPDAKALAELQNLSQAAALERALRDRSAAQIIFHHTGSARVTTGGTSVPEIPLPVLAETRFDMPGLGHFTVKPAAGNDSDDLARAEAAFTTALSRSGLPDLATAQTEANVRAEAIAALRDLDTSLTSLAPQGLPALEAELSALPEAVTPREGLPTVAEAQRAADQAGIALQSAETAHEAARAEAERLRTAEVRASVQATSLANELARAEAVLVTFGEDAEATLLPQLASATTALEEARAKHVALLATAPDLIAAQAAFDRAKSIVESARSETTRLELERAQLDTEIKIQSGAGVMEELADITTRLAAATESLATISFEVAVLKELAATLETARNEARDRYFEPVLAELRPLLRMLWPDAELRFDGESLLPTALVRDGREEPLSILSGGTQEQIALLVRLAFARLLAARGHHAPIIFDDALVYTDDDRIEKMFNALHAQASGQQIIVLSCRQRAFRDLGGMALTVREG